MANSKITLAIASMLFLANGLKAQDDIKKEFDVVRAYKPILGDALKISDNPEIPEASPLNKDFKYTFSHIKVDTTLTLSLLAPETIRQESISKLYGTYLKVGGGNLGGNLVQVYHNNNRKREYNYGVFLSQQGGRTQVEGSNYNRNEVELSGTKIFSAASIKGKIDYKRDRFHDYARNINDSNFVYDDDSLQQTYHNVSAMTEVFSSNKNSYYPIDYSIKVKGNFLTNDFNATELNGGIFSGFSYSVGKNSVKTDISFDHSRTIDIDTTSNSLVNFFPYFHYVDSLFSVKVGINGYSELQSGQPISIYPTIHGTYNIVDKYLLGFVGITGKTEKNNLTNFVALNPFVSPNLDYKFTRERLVLYGGLKGSLSDNSAFDLKVSFKSVENLAFFVPDSNNDGKFNVVYDGKDAGVFEITGGISFIKQQKFNLSGRFTYQEYSLNNLSKPWHTPKLRAKVITQYNIADKILLTFDVFAFGKTFAPTPDFSEEVELKGIVDLNLGIEYRYSKKLSFFVQGNNLSSIKHQRYFNYPSQGFNFMGGLTYAL